ncbi:hypothetical protein ABH940_003396 [Streptacidiphilus sp. BW17]|uniref:hypothetical protein n=1 Tax=Streptacidiphilus sp. BW17 TaxID=3156274 RepID=UPI003519635D
MSLLGPRTLVKAEIQWTMSRHCDEPTFDSHWPLIWIEYVADLCHSQSVGSLADLDLDTCSKFPPQDTKDVGYIETDHFGVRYRGALSLFDPCPGTRQPRNRDRRGGSVRPENTAAAIAARRNQSQQKLDQVTTAIGQLRRERGRLTIRGIAQRRCRPRPPR